MENNTDMQQYLDPRFIYTASIRLHTNGKTEFRKAYAVNKDTLRNYAKWVDADRFVLTKTATYRYDLDFCRNEYTKRALGMKEMQAKVDAALEVCKHD